ncbi:MAG: hypothetical protein R3Y27_03650 [Clostridia bacterium]
MKDYQIHVPSYKWLLGGSQIFGSYNTYSASVGTDPEKGIFSGDILNYNISMQKDDEIEKVVVQIFKGTKSLSETNEDEITSMSFLIEEEDMTQVQEYLEKEIANFEF